MDNKQEKYVGFYCLNLMDQCLLHEEEWNNEKADDMKFYIINSDNVQDAKDELFDMIYEHDLAEEKKQFMAYYAINWLRIQEKEDIQNIFGEEEAKKIESIISLFPENKEDICKQLVPKEYQNLSQETLKKLTKIHMNYDLKIYKAAKEVH